MTPAEANAIAKRIDERRAAALEAFMKRPEIKLLMSGVPPCNSPETLPTLLEAAFSAGAEAGVAGMASEMLAAVKSELKR